MWDQRCGQILEEMGTRGWHCGMVSCPSAVLKILLVALASGVVRRVGLKRWMVVETTVRRSGCEMGQVSVCVLCGVIWVRPVLCFQLTSSLGDC